MITDKLYPLKFESLAKEKVWGGPNLARLFPAVVTGGDAIGEVWLVWDRLRVANGTLAGRTLADVVCEAPEAILGRRPLDATGALFPLLIKLIDAQETLSVQVHPDDAYAQEHEGQPFGKSEAWYVVHAEPGAAVICGLRQEMTRDELHRAILSGRLRQMLNHVPVRTGDVLLNRPGTIHALTPGIVVYEVQQSSDLTYRLYDWDRDDPARSLHIAQSLDVANRRPPARPVIQPVVLDEPGARRAWLCATLHFAAELLTLRSGVTGRPAGACFHALTALAGTSHVRDTSAPDVDYTLAPGESMVVPAAVGAYELWTEDEGATVIKAYVPDLARDVVAPLAAKGIPMSNIEELGIS